jgi:hypothetical protein
MTQVTHLGMLRKSMKAPDIRSVIAAHLHEHARERYGSLTPETPALSRAASCLYSAAFVLLERSVVIAITDH